MQLWKMHNLSHPLIKKFRCHIDYELVVAGTPGLLQNLKHTLDQTYYSLWLQIHMLQWNDYCQRKWSDCQYQMLVWMAVQTGSCPLQRWITGRLDPTDYVDSMELQFLDWQREWLYCLLNGWNSWDDRPDHLKCNCPKRCEFPVKICSPAQLVLSCWSNSVWLSLGFQLKQCAIFSPLFNKRQDTIMVY